MSHCYFCAADFVSGSPCRTTKQRDKCPEWANQTLAPTHNLYRPGDIDAPDQIRDRNGYVVLNMCRHCGRAEIELSEPCV